MALPSFAMGSYGLLFRTKDGLFEIIDFAISLAASRWPDDLEGQRDKILKRLGLDSPNNDHKEEYSAPALPIKETAAPAAVSSGDGIAAEIVVRSNRDRCGDVVGRGRVNIEVELRRPSTKEAAVAKARDRESSLEEEKRKIDCGRDLGFAKEEDRSRGGAPLRRGEGYFARGGGDGRGRRVEAGDHYERRRRSGDGYYRGRKRDFDHDDGGRAEDGYYGCRKRDFDRGERRYGGRRYEEEYSRKRRRIVEEPVATAAVRRGKKHQVIQYSRKFLLSMQPKD